MNIGYESTHKQKCVAGSAFTVHNVSPCYLAEEREIVKKDIENKLFEIFYKYKQYEEKLYFIVGVLFLLAGIAFLAWFGITG